MRFSSISLEGKKNKREKEQTPRIRKERILYFFALIQNKEKKKKEKKGEKKKKTIKDKEK